MQSWAQSYVDFLSIRDFESAALRTNSTELEYFNYLEDRFATQKFSEILFYERPRLAGPRMSLADLVRMSEQTLLVMQQKTSLQQTLGQAFLAPSVRLSPDGQPLNTQDLEKFANLYSSIKTVHDSYGGTFDENRIKKTFAQWQQQKNSKEIARALADALIFSVIEPSTIDRALSRTIPSELLVLHFNFVLKQAYQKGMKLGFPKKILDQLLSYSSFSDFNAKALLKGLVLMPMTREEAVFKGIGPGECVRSSLFRYIDAFFDDAMVLKILKDGVEVGYVTLYKTQNVAKSSEVWMIETIQGPFLNLAKDRQKVLQNLIVSLQTIAATKGAVLAAPRKSFNTFNFKEVSTQLVAMNEYVSGVAAVVDYHDRAEKKLLNQFALGSHSKIDRSILEISGYDKSMMVNAMTLNNGEVQILAPSNQLPPALYEEYLNLYLDSKDQRRIIVEEGVNPLLKKAMQLNALGTDFLTKLQLHDILLQLESAGQHEDAEVVEGFVYNHLPPELRKKGFVEKFAYIEHRVNHVKQDESLATAIKTEVLLSVSTWEEFLQVMRLGDTGATFSNLLIHAFPHFAKMNPNYDRLATLLEFLPFSKTLESDHAFARFFVDQIQTPSDFIRFAKIVTGKEGKVHIDGPLISALLAEESRRFNHLLTREEYWDFYHELMQMIEEKADLQVRSDVAETLLTMEDLLHLKVIGYAEGAKISDQAKQILQIIYSENALRIAGAMPMEDLEAKKSLMRPLFAEFGIEKTLDLFSILAQKAVNLDSMIEMIRFFRRSPDAIYEPSVFGRLRPVLQKQLLEQEPKGLRTLVDRLRIGTADALLAADLASEIKLRKGLFSSLWGFWKSRKLLRILHPEDAQMLLRLMDEYGDNQQFQKDLFLALKRQQTEIFLVGNIESHQRLRAKLAATRVDSGKKYEKGTQGLFETYKSIQTCVRALHSAE